MCSVLGNIEYTYILVTNICNSCSRASSSKEGRRGVGRETSQNWLCGNGTSDAFPHRKQKARVNCMHLRWRCVRQKRIWLLRQLTLNQRRARSAVPRVSRRRRARSVPRNESSRLQHRAPSSSTKAARYSAAPRHLPYEHHKLEWSVRNFLLRLIFVTVLYF